MGDPKKIAKITEYVVDRWGADFSPLEIKFVLHCYAIPTPFTETSTTMVEEMVEKFFKEGIIESGEEGCNFYQCTEKGNHWVKMILSTPFPVQTYIDPRVEGKGRLYPLMALGRGNHDER